MGMFKSFGAIVLAAIAFLVWTSVFVVDEREKALVTQLGEIQREIDEPGLYFKLPFVQEVITIEDRIVFFESPDKEVQVVDSRRYVVDTVTMIRVNNPRLFRETVGASLNRAKDRIETRLDAALRQTYGRRSFDAALSKDRAAMMREIRDQVRLEAEALGIEVVDVKIRRTDLLEQVLKDTYARMNSERFAEAAELRAIGEAQATRIKAEADRQSVELVSKAQRESEILRGEGDATRNKVFAEAFQQDPEFFAFYRSMQAYTNSLSNSDTTLVLKPDSEFFQYFGTQQSTPGR
ncbi:MAG: protease modulator HflC [Pseudomonadota bacterium]